MKIKKITPKAPDHTWDISTLTECYVLENGCISHNTSSQLSNSTNGIEPIRSFITIKQSKDGVIKQVAPEYKKLKHKYDLLWDQKSPHGYLKICAVFQKFIDQAMSVNTSYNPAHFENEELPMSVLMKDLLLSYQLGIKTLYYFNTNDGAGEIDVASALAKQEECDACVL